MLSSAPETRLLGAAPLCRTASRSQPQWQGTSCHRRNQRARGYRGQGDHRKAVSEPQRMKELDSGSWVIFELPGFTTAASGTEQVASMHFAKASATSYYKGNGSLLRVKLVSTVTSLAAALTAAPAAEPASRSAAEPASRPAGKSNPTARARAPGAGRGLFVVCRNAAQSVPGIASGERSAQNQASPLVFSGKTPPCAPVARPAASIRSTRSAARRSAQLAPKLIFLEHAPNGSRPRRRR